MNYLRLSRRCFVFFCLDLVLVSACYYLAFVVRHEKLLPRQLPTVLLPSLPVAVAGVIAGMVITGVYRSMIEYTSVEDLISIIKGAVIGDGVLLFFIMAAYGMAGFPRSVFVLFPLFVVGSFSITRIGFRLVTEVWGSGGDRIEKGVSVPIVGAGDAAADLIREMQRNPRKTVIELDLVGYSTIGDNLEQGLDVKSVAQLNQQIQSFIDTGLQAVGVAREEAVMAMTGDGAILVFDLAQEAHRFAEAVHAATAEHNRTRRPPLTKRVFRSGAATGEIVMQPKAGGGFEFAGITIARAVRLEAKAHPGALQVDEATYDNLSVEQRACYGAKTKVTGKRDEEFETYSCQLNTEGPQDASFFTEQTGKQLQPDITREFGTDQRRKVLARFKQLKSHQYPELIFLLELPIRQRPPDILNLEEKKVRILVWAEENDRLSALLEVLSELTMGVGSSRPK